MTRYLVLGNGAAGVTAAEEIRRHDARSEITIVSAEPYPMYSRPGLAYVILNEIPDRQIMARSPEWYAELNLRRVRGSATKLDATNRRVQLADGQSLSYDQLLIATGARAVGLPYLKSPLEGDRLPRHAGRDQRTAQARQARPAGRGHWRGHHRVGDGRGLRPP